MIFFSKTTSTTPYFLSAECPLGLVSRLTRHSCQRSCASDYTPAHLTTVHGLYAYGIFSPSRRQNKVRPAEAVSVRQYGTYGYAYNAKVARSLSDSNSRAGSLELGPHCASHLVFCRCRGLPWRSPRSRPRGAALLTLTLDLTLLHHGGDLGG